MAKLFAISGDPDQTPRSAVSDLGLHCLQFTLFRVSRLQWVKCTMDQFNHKDTKILIHRWKFRAINTSSVELLCPVVLSPFGSKIFLLKVGLFSERTSCSEKQNTTSQKLPSSLKGRKTCQASTVHLNNIYMHKEWVKKRTSMRSHAYHNNPIQCTCTLFT